MSESKPAVKCPARNHKGSRNAAPMYSLDFPYYASLTRETIDQFRRSAVDIWQLIDIHQYSCFRGKRNLRETHLSFMDLSRLCSVRPGAILDATLGCETFPKKDISFADELHRRSFAKGFEVKPIITEIITPGNDLFDEPRFEHWCSNHRSAFWPWFKTNGTILG